LKLERNLKQLPKEEREDVIMEIRSHIYESIGEPDENIPFPDKTELPGRNEKLEGVLKKLGEPKDYARLLISQHIGEVVEKGSFEANFKTFFRQMFFPFLISAIALLVVMFSNTVFLYYEFISKGIPTFDIFKLLLFNLPAIVVVIIPMCVLFTVPNAFYTMVKSSEKINSIKSFKVWAMVILVGIISTISASLITEFIVPESNHQAVETSFKLLEMQSQKPLTFSNQKSIQEMNFLEARQKIDRLKEIGVDTRTMEFFLYSKISIPLASLASAIFGAFIGCLLLSEIFHRGYTVFVIGLIAPVYTWNYIYNTLENNSGLNPLSAFVPDLIIAGLGLLMILGIFLKGKTEKI
jgi:lipopolysaccharide export LptBFGC system permease protein LptF